MTKRWYNIYTDERNGARVEYLLKDIGLRYSVKYAGLVVYFSINVNENGWYNLVKKCLKRLEIQIKFTKNNLAGEPAGEFGNGPTGHGDVCMSDADPGL